MVKLDEKCTIILRILDGNSGGTLSIETLYKATKPTQYRGLNKRLYKLTEAGLTEFVPGYKMKLTDLGREVAPMLKSEDEIEIEEIMDFNPFE